MQSPFKLARSILPCLRGASHNAEERTAPMGDLMSDLKRHSDDLIKQRRLPVVCYALALHAGVAAKTISPGAEAKMMDAARNGYSPEYLKLMGITVNNDSATFSAEQISESGILNFKETDRGVVMHTAYLHKDAQGGLTLVHNNCSPLDKAMVDAGSMPTQLNGLLVYTGTTGLQNYLNTGYSFHFTPAGHLNRQAG